MCEGLGLRLVSSEGELFPGKLLVQGSFLSGFCYSMKLRSSLKIFLLDFLNIRDKIDRITVKAEMRMGSIEGRTLIGTHEGNISMIVDGHFSCDYLIDLFLAYLRRIFL